MAYRINPALTDAFMKYGGDTAEKCFNCGNCTAVCSITEGDTAFPRQFIRYMQLGMTDRMMESPEPWMCYYCADCSETCPREAEPGKLMASARRWLVGQYDFTGLARLFYTSAPASVVVMALLAVILGFFMMSGSGPMRMDEIALWEYLSPEVVHNVGIAVIILVVIIGLAGVVNMGRHMSRGAIRRNELYGPPKNPAGASWFLSSLKTAFLQVLGHKRYVTCDEDKELGVLQKPWFIHGATAWGFFGLLIATMAHWILDIVGLKETATWVPVYSVPIRVLGIIAGLFLMYGTSMLMMKRFSKSSKQYEDSFASDWIFLLFMWFAGLTGFLTLLGEYLTPPQSWTYFVLLIHVVISMELVLLAPFTKFAHVFYRTVAVFIEEQRASARA